MLQSPTSARWTLPWSCTTRNVIRLFKRCSRSFDPWNRIWFLTFKLLAWKWQRPLLTSNEEWEKKPDVIVSVAHIVHLFEAAVCLPCCVTALCPLCCMTAVCPLCCMTAVWPLKRRYMYILRNTSRCSGFFIQQASTMCFSKHAARAIFLAKRRFQCPLYVFKKTKFSNVFYLFLLISTYFYLFTTYFLLISTYFQLCFEYKISRF